MSEVTVGTFDINDPELLEEARRLAAERRRENERRHALDLIPTDFTAPTPRFDANGDYRE